MSEMIIGIDLGTTNSEVAAMQGGQVRVLGPGDNKILPSCVGFTADGELLIGETARRQQALYPERTVRSIKRKMGSDETVTLGEKEFRPQEISALILRELVNWAERSLGERPKKAVITVPAYFSDAQRNATREAGALAGLEVARILNEPTAASLAYGYGDGSRHTVLVYDLGGGTFDVSVVAIEGDITEVLASHGNNRLGGDDFDDLLADHLAEQFFKQHKVDLRNGHPAARARLWWAAEEAKKKLSFEPHVKIREEALLVDGRKPLHLEYEIDRDEYEDLIRPLVESTLDSVAKALADCGKRARDLDAVLLVGGSTRTPLVAGTLIERTGLEPRQDVHPDLCVALGAGVLASRLAGHSVDRVLVDVSPYSFGISFIGELDQEVYSHCYKPIIRRNTPLPLTRTESYATSHPYQTEVDIEVYQGDDRDALKNILVGEFTVEGLTPMPVDNEILCRMRLDLDGILEVTALEKSTGLSKRVTIDNALRARTAEEIAAGQKRILELYETREEAGYELDTSVVEAEEPVPVSAPVAPANGSSAAQGAGALLERSRRLLAGMHPDDREEAIELHERIEAAIASGDERVLKQASEKLKELLFFIEGQS